MLIFNKSRYFLYIEGIFILLHGWVGSFKIKYPFGIYFDFDYINGDIRSLPFVLNSKLFQLSYNFLFFEKFSKLNYRVSYGSFTKIRVRGRGYKIIKNVNSLVFRLGYSHKLFYLLSLSVLFKPHKRMKRNVPWRVYGICADIIRNVCYVIHSFRKPDIYCKLGIYLYGREVLFKQGVKPYRL